METRDDSSFVSALSAEPKCAESWRYVIHEDSCIQPQPVVMVKP